MIDPRAFLEGMERECGVKGDRGHQEREGPSSIQGTQSTLPPFLPASLPPGLPPCLPACLPACPCSLAPILPACPFPARLPPLTFSVHFLPCSCSPPPVVRRLPWVPVSNKGAARASRPSSRRRHPWLGAKYPTRQVSGRTATPCPSNRHPHPRRSPPRPTVSRVSFRFFCSSLPFPTWMVELRGTRGTARSSPLQPAGLCLCFSVLPHLHFESPTSPMALITIAADECTNRFGVPFPSRSPFLSSLCSLLSFGSLELLSRPPPSGNCGGQVPPSARCLANLAGPAGL